MVKEREPLATYIHQLYDGVPTTLYVVLLLIAVVVGGYLFYKYKRDKSGQYFAYLLIIEYLVLLYCSTVFFRTNQTFRKYNLHPFWSYENFDYHANEILMNYLVFIPFGVLLGVVLRANAWLKVFLIGLGTSILIEIMQLAFKKGFTEVDDIMHNTVGCMVGYLIYLFISKCIVKSFCV